MTRRARRTHSPAFKVKVAVAAIRGDRTLSELAKQFDVQPDQITAWKPQLLEGANGDIWGCPGRRWSGADDRHQGTAREDRRVDIAERFFARSARQGRFAERKAMIGREHDLALVTQADLLGVARSSLYRRPRTVPAAEPALMRRIDELHLDHPFAGNRMMRDMLVNEGTAIGRTHVRTLMRQMGDRGVVPATTDQQTRTRPQDLPVPAA